MTIRGATVPLEQRIGDEPVPALAGGALEPGE
jgi:hypothetical protein